MSYFTHEFDAVIEQHDLGTMRYTVIFLPDEMAAQLPFDRHPRLRMSGELADQPFTGAWQPGKGRWYLMLGKALLKATGLCVGACATVRFRLEPQDSVEVPPALLRAIDANAEAMERWATLTPGKQRALAHSVLSAKSSATTMRRVTQVVDWLVAGETDLHRLGKLDR